MTNSQRLRRKTPLHRRLAWWLFGDVTGRVVCRWHVPPCVCGPLSGRITESRVYGWIEALDNWLLKVAMNDAR